MRGTVIWPFFVLLAGLCAAGFLISLKHRRQMPAPLLLLLSAVAIAVLLYAGWMLTSVFLQRP